MRRIVAALFVCVFSLSANAAQEPLLGTYAIKDKKGLHDFVKIEKQDGAYVMYDRHKDKWRQTKELLSPVTKEQLEKMLKHKVDFSFVGLGSKNMAIFKVADGWEDGKFKTNTGYFIFSWLGPLEVHKR